MPPNNIFLLCPIIDCHPLWLPGQQRHSSVRAFLWLCTEPALAPSPGTLGLNIPSLGGRRISEARQHGTLAKHYWAGIPGLCCVYPGKSLPLSGPVFPPVPGGSGQDVAWSPLTPGWEVSFVRLILFRKTLGLTGSMASQRVRASKATRGHKDGNLRPQRSEPTAEPAWDQ